MTPIVLQSKSAFFGKIWGDKIQSCPTINLYGLMTPIILQSKSAFFGKIWGDKIQSCPTINLYVRAL